MSNQVTKEQAIQFLENLAQSAYTQGTVAVTPAVFDHFRQVIEVLRPEPPKEDGKPKKKK